jgi:hypothetical protein
VHQHDGAGSCWLGVSVAYCAHVAAVPPTRLAVQVRQVIQVILVMISVALLALLVLLHLHYVGCVAGALGMRVRIELPSADTVKMTLIEHGGCCCAGVAACLALARRPPAASGCLVSQLRDAFPLQDAGTAVSMLNIRVCVC